MKRLAAPLALLALCGCAGIDSIVNGGGTCGPNFATPNYVLGNDPGTGNQNITLSWSRFPLRVFIRDRVTFQGQISSDDVIRGGIDKWRNAIGSALGVQYVGSESQADIVIRIRDQANRPPNGQPLGVTNVSYVPSTGQLVSADIELVTWSTMSRTEFETGLRGTAGHEFGHALFLLGHSPNQSDLMYFQKDPAVDPPVSGRDVNSLVTAYCGTFGGNAPVAPQGPVVTRTISCPSH